MPHRRYLAPFSPFAWIALLLLSASIASSHPVPDLPVRSHFNHDGSAEIRVEVDPRCFADDPEAVDYYQREAIEKLPPNELQKLKAQADLFIGQRLRFIFEPVGEVKPKFVWSFQNLGDGFVPFETDDDSLLTGDEVVLVGSWKTNVVSGMTGYRIEALDMAPEKLGIPLNVMFLNHIGGKQVERYAVLFPGENSFTLDLTALAAPKDSVTPIPGAVGIDADTGDWFSLFWSEIKRGFVHVVPYGLDHILFVLGLFLLSRKWKPLILQISTFTVAHTLTLWLASAGVVNISPNVVEPIIAASIVVIALENIFHRRYSHWRLLIIFIFGLVHGLGFAGVMATRLDSTASLVVGLLGINIGVEFGQLAVIAVALAATWWIPETHYRKSVVIPGSILIAIAGVWWVIERTAL